MRLYLFSSDLERRPARLDRIGSVLTDVVGVGLIESAIGTARAIQRHRPSEVVFVGTAGAYPGSRFGVGDVIVPMSATVISGDLARGEMRAPALLTTDAVPDRALSANVTTVLRRNGLRADAGTVGCTLGVTEAAELALTLAAFRESDAENLEAFGVIRACVGVVPCAVALGITNIVGPHGGTDWKSNYHDSMARLFTALVSG